MQTAKTICTQGDILRCLELVRHSRTRIKKEEGLIKRYLRKVETLKRGESA